MNANHCCKNCKNIAGCLGRDEACPFHVLYEPCGETHTCVLKCCDYKKKHCCKNCGNLSGCIENEDACPPVVLDHPCVPNEIIDCIMSECKHWREIDNVSE